MFLLKRNGVRGALLVVLGVGGLLSDGAQPSPASAEISPPYPPAVLPVLIPAEDPAFKPIFDGKTLRDWDGDRNFWRVEGGVIVGETTEQRPLPEKSGGMLIWRGGKPADFELKVEYRVSAVGNSGIQYRSSELPWMRWGLRGYQADIDGADAGERFYEEFSKPRGLEARRITGMNYHEWGRTFLALPGQLSYVPADKPAQVLASLGEPAALARVIRDDWNQYHLIARGNVLIHIVNSRVMSVVIDDDAANRRSEGLLGLQIHAGHPMKVEYRSVRLKSYTN